MFFRRSKNKPWVAFAIVIALIMGLVPLFLSSPRASGGSGIVIEPGKVTKTFPPLPSSAELGDREAVRVGVYILSVGNLDTTTGRYTMDFFLNFICETVPCDPSEFDLMNASADTSIEDQTDPSVRGEEFYYRIRASLRTNLDLRNFPFDEHILEIELEDKNKNDQNYVLIADPDQSGIDSSVYVSGWNLEPQISGGVTSHDYDVYDEAYSRARFSIRIYHPWFSSFMKGLFAAIVIVGVGMLSFLMKPEDSGDRLELTSATLASAIFYHLTLTASIPPVGYLTYADRFMILQYIFITISLGVAVALFLLQPGEGEEPDPNQQATANQIHNATRWLVPILWIISMIVLHWTSIGF
jgi:hypothetical protein